MSFALVVKLKIKADSIDKFMNAVKVNGEAARKTEPGCRTFDIPVTGGNVSFYNDTEGSSIYPTPVLGIVGLVPDIEKSLGPGFKEEGDIIFLIGDNKDEIGGSEYLRVIWNREEGLPPRVDLEKEKLVQEVCLEAIEKQLLRSAHDVSEGGLAVCLAECVLLGENKVGCVVLLESRMREDSLLFSETQSRIVVTAKPEARKDILKIALERDVSLSEIGTTGGERICISHQKGKLVDLSVEDCYRAWKEAIPGTFKIR